MNINSVTQTAVYPQKLEELKNSQNGSLQAQSSAVTEQAKAGKDVYIPSKETEEDAGVYKSNTALVEQLKAEQAAIQERFLRTVRETITLQGQAAASVDNIWKLIAQGDYTVDPQTKAAAEQAISEDGYWGVKQTSQRIVDFAKALAGTDPAMAEMAREAVIKGFKEAEEAWGGSLPSICGETYNAVMTLFDEWEQGSGEA